ncbi:MAG: helix-turn-helix transcriptional regulator [Ruminococcus sp.]|nr:helix-turn-helix transcriptional regulator [Ruminococcus sp.]
MNKNVEIKIGKNIRQLRESQGLTQEMLAAQLQTRGCDLTRSAIAKIEIGARHLYPDEMKLIKDILKADYKDIYE